MTLLANTSYWVPSRLPTQKQTEGSRNTILLRDPLGSMATWTGGQIPCPHAKAGGLSPEAPKKATLGGLFFLGGSSGILGNADPERGPGIPNELCSNVAASFLQLLFGSHGLVLYRVFSYSPFILCQSFLLAPFLYFCLLRDVKYVSIEHVFGGGGWGWLDLCRLGANRRPAFAEAEISPALGTLPASSEVLRGSVGGETFCFLSLPMYSGTIGVHFGCFGRKIDGDSWFTCWFNHLPGKPIYFPKKDAYDGNIHRDSDVGSCFFASDPFFGPPRNGKKWEGG